MKLFNFLFYFLLFIGFFLPTNANFYLPLPGILLKVNELAFILLPIVNVWCTSKNQVRFNDFRLKRNIILLIGIVIFTEIVVKNFIYNQPIADAFKTIRIGLPLFSSLVLLVQGIRADVRTVWKVLLWAILSSVILSILSIFITLPIYYNLETGANILDETRGRIMNSNAAFGIIGLYLLFKDKDKWYNQGSLVKITSILSIFSLILTFNRTYLALLVLEVIILISWSYSFKAVLKISGFTFVLFCFSLYLYNSVEIIQRQVDERILSVFKHETTIQKSTIEGNRDKIYEGISSKLEEGHWIIGLPYRESIFEYFNYEYRFTGATKTDISFVNVLLRYGIFSLSLYLLIFKRFYRLNLLIPVVFWMFVLASLNTDALLNQNSVFFLFLLVHIKIGNEMARGRFHQ